MEALANLLGGFKSALSITNLFMAFAGTLLGTLVGVLPGLGPTSTIAMLMPLTAVLSPSSAIIMMAGIYYGAQYGGSTTSIIANIPGEVASVPTLLDGHPLAQQGKAGPALGIAAIGSFVAGTLGVVLLTFFTPFLADQALRFGPPEYFGLMLLALTVMVSVSGSSIIKGLLMGAFGYLIALTGIGPESGLPRFHYGFPVLYGGIEIVTIAIGIFALGELFTSFEQGREAVTTQKIGRVFPNAQDLKQTFPAMARGGIIGFVLGLLPGCNPAVTAYISYDVEKKVSRHPERFGHGALEGVAAPESANNATSSAAFVPLLALGIPASPALAVLMGGFMIYGLQPGPLLFKTNPDLVWTIIGSMYIGNVMLLVLNLPLVGLWARLTAVPYRIMAPIIMMLCLVGAYSLRNSTFDIVMTICFGVVGYLMRKYDWPAAPVVLGSILGPILEKALVNSLAMSAGNPMIFITRPICLTLILAACALLIVSAQYIRKSKRSVTEEY
ncbi:MAG TPA: tripartite tricarboxylate transporter permease [Syntrophorhabdaceae bacterium]|nr:tripartite tricarboxylate transporter permease [Syntrophorhabdaceae bacterium]HQM80741.1 tripartite tricarboxylate transporter permease [Syntrophorhabdaceae bacterium]